MVCHPRLELDGDEMTRIICSSSKTRAAFIPILDIDSKYYDLGMEITRDETMHQVTIDAANANPREYGVGIKYVRPFTPDTDRG